MKFDTTKLNQLSKKQKILIPLIILAFAYVIWQVYDMFSGGSVVSVTTSASTNNSAATKATSSAAVPQKAPGETQPTTGSVSTSDAANQQQETTATTSTAVPQTGNISDLSGDAGQMQYVQMLNQYQLLKMKRMLLEEQVAIAAARQKIADLNSKTNDLGGGDSEFDAGNSDDSNSNLAALPTGKDSYKVVYIDRQNGEWNATINHSGKFEEVNVGSELSDGSQVISIDASGVILKQGTKLNKITFSGENPVDYAAPINKAQNQVQPTIQNGTKPGSAQATIENKDLQMPEQKKKNITPLQNKVESAEQKLQVSQKTVLTEAPAKTRELSKTITKENIAPATNKVDVPPSTNQTQIIRIKIVSQNNTTVTTESVAPQKILPKQKSTESFANLKASEITQINNQKAIAEKKPEVKEIAKLEAAIAENTKDKTIVKPVPTEEKAEPAAVIPETVKTQVKPVVSIPVVVSGEAESKKPVHMEQKSLAKETSLVKKEVVKLSTTLPETKLEAGKPVMKPVPTEEKAKVAAVISETVKAQVKPIVNIPVVVSGKEESKKPEYVEQKSLEKEAGLVKKEVVKLSKTLPETKSETSKIVMKPIPTEEKAKAIVEKTTNLEAKNQSKKEASSIEKTLVETVKLGITKLEKKDSQSVISVGSATKSNVQEKPTVSDQQPPKAKVEEKNASIITPIATTKSSSDVTYSAANKEELKKLLVDLQKNAALKQLKGTNEATKSLGENETLKPNGVVPNNVNKLNSVQNHAHEQHQKSTVHKISSMAEPIVVISNTKSVLGK